jgi:uncharacterized membrane protein
VGLRVSALVEKLRSSLFFVPTLLVILGAGLAQAMIGADSAIGDDAGGLPFVLTSTVDSAREVLGIVASATITVAGIAFSVSLLVIQQASSQYSPRVVHSLFRDPFNRRVMGVAVGTFTYCLIALRAVRGPLEEGGEPVVPNLTVALAVVLGVGAILAIVAFIDHNAHTMEASQILGRISEDTKRQFDRSWPEPDSASDGVSDVSPEEGHTVRFRTSGWLQQISPEQLLDLVPDGGTVRLETAVGRYAVEGTPLCTIWPAPNEPEEAAASAAQAIHVGPVRTMQQDPSYGLRQLADVALLALSPGVNDPTTAQEAIFHLTDVLRHAFVRDAPAAHVTDDRGRCLVNAEPDTHERLIELAFGEIRRTAGSQPRVCVYLLEALHLLHESMLSMDRVELALLLGAQAELVVVEARRAGGSGAEMESVHDAFERRFGAEHRSRSS